MGESRVTFYSGELELEGMLSLPQGQGPFPGVVVCHPHPLYGGNMHNNVVRAVCLGLEQKGMASLRFNFRGVRRSQGAFSNGVGEQEDALAALFYLASHPEIDKSQIGLAGYSFGARVAMSAAPKDPRIKAVAFIAPPASSLNPSLLSTYRSPKLFLCGDLDSFLSHEELSSFARGLPPPSECRILSGADHFFAGREGELAEEIADFFLRTFKANKA